MKAETIAIAIITATLGAAAAGGTLLVVTTIIVGLALSVGTSLLAQMFMRDQAQTKPSARQTIVSAPIMPRVRAYGRVRLGGGQVFKEAHDQTLWSVVVHHDGEVDAIEEYVIDTTVVSVDPVERGVTDDGYLNSGWRMVHIWATMGTAAPAFFSDLHTAFPDWTTDALGKGQVATCTSIARPPQSSFLKIFPNGARTAIRLTLRASKVWDPRDDAQDPSDPSTWTWTSNAALCTLDHLRHETGFGTPLTWITPEIEAWKAAADACDAAVPLAAGGTVARYLVGGSYDYAERPGDVQTRLLAACNGRLWMGPNGGITIAVGVWQEPTVVIDDAALVSYRVVSGADGAEVANTLTAAYTDPGLGFIESDAQPWVNAASVARFGERKSDARLYMVPTHSQARRLMKQASARLAPAWKGTLVTNLRALPALTERFVRVTIGELGLDFTAEIDDVQFRIEDGSVVTGLSIYFTAVEAAGFDWDALTEEGTPSSVPSPVGGTGMFGPANFNVLVVSGGGGPVARAFWNPPADGIPGLPSGYDVRVEYRLVGGSSWDSASATAELGTLDVTGLTEDAAYEFRAVTVATSSTSPYVGTITRTLTVDATAPDAPTALSVDASAEAATIAWTLPASANCYGARVYRHTADDAGAATLQETAWSAPGATLSREELGIAPGTYWWWVAAINGSGVESARTPAGTATIT